MNNAIGYPERESSPLVILRREYLEAIMRECDRLGKDVCKRVLCCAAKLMDYWFHWRNWKLKSQRTDWIYQPLKAIYQDLMGEHSLHVIRSALDLLRELRLLNRRSNPGNAQDRTYQYQVNMDGFNELMGIPEFTLEDGEFRSESPKFTAEKSDRSQLPSTAIESNKTTQSVENEQVRSGSIPEKPQRKSKAQTATTAEESEPVDPETFRAILEESSEAGAENNKQFQGFVRKKIREWGAAAVDRFRQGIQAMKEQKTLKNPTGYLIAAVERGFTPNAEKAKPTTQNYSGPEPLPAASPARSPIPEQPKAPDGFNEWFDLARSIGLVLGSTWQEGEMWVFTPRGDRESWEVMRKLHPLAELEELATARNGAV